MSCMKSSRRAAPLFVVKSLVKERGGGRVPIMAVLMRCCVWRAQWTMMWLGVRRSCPHGQACDSGGSVGRNRFAYDPVKAWSTASWRAVDVVRRVYSGLVGIFRPCSSRWQSTKVPVLHPRYGMSSPSAVAALVGPAVMGPSNIRS